MTGRIGLIVFVAFVFLVVAPASAQTPGLDVLSNTGTGRKAPAGALGSPGNTMESSTTSFAQLLSFHINLSERQSVGINTEFLKLASFYFRMRGYEEQPDWKLKAVPITLTYERILSAPTNKVVPVVGVGVSYYLTQLKTRLPESVTGPQLSTTPIDSYVERYVGMGIGAQATAGIRARISRQTFLQLQARYRLVDGLGVTPTKNADASFGVFDFAIGFGFSI